MKNAKKPRYQNQEEVLKKIGERMKEIRKQMGYDNYETFAYEKGIPRAQYGRYERGSDLKLSSLMKVLDGFDMSFYEFFNGLEKE